MKADLSSYSKSYRAGLRKHLREGAASSRKSSLSLGHRAVKLGLETLDVAMIHEDALNSLKSSTVSKVLCRNNHVRRAARFFAEVIAPIEETHRGPKEANARMKIAAENLSRRTKELAAMKERLQHEIDRRKTAESALRASEAVSNDLVKQSRRMQEELRLHSHRVLSIQETERRRISRELHDVVAQALTALDMQLAGLMKQSAADAKDFRKKIAATHRLVKKSVAIVHRFARDLRPTALDDLGLIPALRSHLKEFMEETGIRVALNAFAGVEEVDNEVRTALFRVAQEALSNIAQHAKASQATVVIQKQDETICMEIHDNGIGFEVDGVVFTKSEGLGLLGMRERVEMLGGRFSVDSAPGRETAVRVGIAMRISRARKRSPTSPVKPLPKCP